MRLKPQRWAKRPRHVDLRWRTIAASESDGHPRAVDDLIAQRIDGMTITGILTADEIQAALPRLESYRREATDEVFGAMLGMPLTQVEDGTDRGPHLDDTEKCRALYGEAFGFDPHERIASVLRPMANGREPRPPLEANRPYNPGNVRWYDPGLGGLRAHVGNEFRLAHEEGAMSHLIATTDIHNHLSYFVVLQPPEQGGALSVFDLLWDSYQPDGREQWYLEDDSDFDEQPAMQHHPGPGDMILFGGGWRWHRIDPIGGNVPRITYGGFLAPSTDGDALHLWS